MPFLAIFARNLVFYNKNNKVLLSQALFFFCILFLFFFYRYRSRNIQKKKITKFTGPGPMCDRFPRKFDVQTSYKPSNLIFVVNIKFPRATYHTIMPSTEELYCLIRVRVISLFELIASNTKISWNRCLGLKTKTSAFSLGLNTKNKDFHKNGRVTRAKHN